jgi:hypothetical protein
LGHKIFYILFNYISYNKLNDLVIYLKKAEEGSELAKFRDILKNLKNKTARVINQKK